MTAGNGNLQIIHGTWNEVIRMVYVRNTEKLGGRTLTEVFFFYLILVNSTGQLSCVQFSWRHLTVTALCASPWIYKMFLEGHNLSSPRRPFVRPKEPTGKDLNRCRTFNRLDGHSTDSVPARKLNFNGLLLFKGILSFIHYHLKMKIRCWKSQNYLNVYITLRISLKTRQFF